MYDGDSRSHCHHDFALQSNEILRTIGDSLLAFMLLSSSPLDDDHSLLKLDDRPIQDRSVMILTVFCSLLTLHLSYHSEQCAGSSRYAIICQEQYPCDVIDA